MYFAEKHFTTAQFSESTKQIRALLEEPEIAASSRIVLQSTLIASAFASRLSKSVVTEQFATLQEVIAKQEPNFTVQWTFDGTKNFINHYGPLAPYRNWLLAFFEALTRGNKPAIQQELNKLQGELTHLLETLPR